jgi:hypothetical protein
VVIAKNFAVSDQPMKLATLIENHTSALGGLDALNSIHPMRFNGRMVEPKFTLEAFNVIWMKPHFQKVWIPVGEGYFAEGYNGECAWEKPVADAHGHIVEGAPSDALRHALELPGVMRPLTEFLARGNTLELINEGEVEGRWVYALKATLTDGFVKAYYMDAETHLFTRSRDVRAFHPALDLTENHVETVMSDFRSAGGVMVAFRESQRDWVTGEMLGELTWRTVEINPELKEENFLMP